MGFPIYFSKELPGMDDTDVAIDTYRIKPFIQILGHGFLFKFKSGSSVKACLRDGLGIDPDYLENRIQTVFLNEKPVDDVDAAPVVDGSRLALSAAMPGLAGATFRKGGYFAAMRIETDFSETVEPASAKMGEVTIKLFNLVAGELGPLFLKNGIRISGPYFKDFLDRQSKMFWDDCHCIHSGGQNITTRQFQTLDLSRNEILLKVNDLS